MLSFSCHIIHGFLSMNLKRDWWNLSTVMSIVFKWTSSNPNTVDPFVLNAVYDYTHIKIDTDNMRDSIMLRQNVGKATAYFSWVSKNE